MVVDLASCIPMDVAASLHDDATHIMQAAGLSP